jgi:hypothetical protein
MTLHFRQITLLRPGRSPSADRAAVVLARFEQLNVKAWLIAGI